MKARVLLPGTYGLLTLGALIWMWGHSGNVWCAIYAVLLTTPWSLLIRNVSTPLFWDLLVIGCAVLNGSILFLIGKGIDHTWMRKTKHSD